MSLGKFCIQPENQGERLAFRDERVRRAVRAVTLERVMNRSLEVRVRTGIAFFVAGVASAGLCLGTARGQTATPQTDSSAPATQTVPAPTPQDSTQSAPAYGQQPTQAAPQSLPAPVQAPPPVVTSAPPTPQTPYTAMPAYGTPEAARAPGDSLGSAYIPVDSWVYPAMMRLYSMG